MDSINTERIKELLKMTENQRTSILPDDAPVGAEEATTPAEIKSILQIQ